VLVTAGKLRGKIWSVDADGLPLAGWWPDARPPGLLEERKLISGKLVKGFQLGPPAYPPI